MKVVKPATLSDRLAAVERIVRSLATATPLASGSIDDATGSSIMRTGILDTAGRIGISVLSGVQEILRVGQIHSLWGADEVGLQIRRRDGTVAMELSTPTGQVAQSLSLWDRGLNEVVGEDTATGQGLSRPYVPLVLANLDMSTASHTTATSWTDMEQAIAYKQHPTVFLQALVQTDSATTASVRLWDGSHGVQVGSTATVGAGAFVYVTFGPAQVTGAHMATLDLRVQAQTTSGTGAVHVRTVAAYGRQT